MNIVFNFFYKMAGSLTSINTNNKSANYTQDGSANYTQEGTPRANIIAAKTRHLISM